MDQLLFVIQILQQKWLKFTGVVVGIDAKDGYVAVQGWGEVSSIKAVDLAKKNCRCGCRSCDLHRYLTKTECFGGVNVDFSLQIARSSKLETIASGGVSDINDILALKETKEIAGVIVGKLTMRDDLI